MGMHVPGQPLEGAWSFEVFERFGPALPLGCVDLY